MALQILLVWAKGPPSIEDVKRVGQALSDAEKIFGTLTLHVWGQVNRGEDGPLPSGIGYDEKQDYVDADSVSAQDFIKTRNFYLDASNRLTTPVYVLFVVPAGELVAANGFSLRGGYCSVVPVPTGVPGTADGNTYAHEIAHGLSLAHVDVTDNLMFPFRVVGPGRLSGDALTVEQYKQMREFLQAVPWLSQE